MSQIIASPTCSQLHFQQNWFGRKFFRYIFQSSWLLKKSHVILLRWARIKSSWRRPFVMSGLHATRCSRNHICDNETQHSRCVERVAFVIYRALIVSVMSAGTKVWPCSICSRKCNNLTLTPYRLLGNETYPRMTSSKASIWFWFHFSRRPWNGVNFLDRPLSW